MEFKLRGAAKASASSSCHLLVQQ
uniref:Kch3 n=1 Tax=Arundo donax TaxID=35708 RepID=A0A0A9HAR7_ARUDO